MATLNPNGTEYVQTTSRVDISVAHAAEVRIFLQQSIEKPFQFPVEMPELMWGLWSWITIHNNNEHRWAL